MERVRQERVSQERVFQERVFKPNRMLSTRRFAAAVAIGELRSDLDVDTAVDLAFGPLWFRLLLGTAPVTEEHAVAVAELALSGGHLVVTKTSSRASPLAARPAPTSRSLR